MYTFAITLLFSFVHTCFCQLQVCYQAVDGEVAGDFPCDPDANVSSCCSPGNICSSNLYCISASNQQNYVGTCTDMTWNSPACPFNLSPYLLDSSSASNIEISLTIAALATGRLDPWYDKFNYALNTTQCADGSLCPFKDNHHCCDTEQGIHEIHYNYTNKAVMPSNIFELTAFYATAGYTFPTSIPSASTLPRATRL